MAEELSIQFEAFGIIEDARMFQNMGEHAKHAEPAFERIADFFARQVKGQFDSEGVQGGDPWPDLSKNTIAKKSRSGMSGGMLRATDHLFRSLTEGGSESVREITPESLVWGSTVYYGRFHQDGTSRMPQRMILQLRAKDRARIARIMLLWIRQGRLTKTWTFS
jgi:phage gpG-like protein